MSRVAVVMACFNGSHTIAKAINSILTQTFTDFTFYVVDDASTDDTVSIVTSFSDPRLVLLRLTENSGPSAARNFALQNSTEEYVAILDADDWSYPDRLKTQVEFLDTNPEIALVGGFSESIQKNSNTLSVQYRPLSPPAVKWNQLFRNSFAHSTVMYRNSVARLFNYYDLEMKQAEDFSLFSEILSSYSACNLPCVFTRYSTRPDGISRRFSNQLRFHASQVVQKNLAAFISVEIDLDSCLFLHGATDSYSDKEASCAIATYFLCFQKLMNISMYSTSEKRELVLLVSKHAASFSAHSPNQSASLLRMLLGALMHFHFLSLLSFEIQKPILVLLRNYIKSLVKKARNV